MVLKTKPPGQRGELDAEELPTLGLVPKPRSPKSVYQERNQCILFWVLLDNGQRVFCL